MFVSGFLAEFTQGSNGWGWFVEQQGGIEGACWGTAAAVTAPSAGLRWEGGILRTRGGECRRNPAPDTEQCQGSKEEGRKEENQFSRETQYPAFF